MGLEPTYQYFRPNSLANCPLYHLSTLPFFCGKSETRTHTPLGPTVFKTAELRPTALIFPFLRKSEVSIPIPFGTTNFQD